jgi:hypothetical protein
MPGDQTHISNLTVGLSGVANPTQTLRCVTNTDTHQGNVKVLEATSQQSGHSQTSPG